MKCSLLKTLILRVRVTAPWKVSHTAHLSKQRGNSSIIEGEYNNEIQVQQGPARELTGSGRGLVLPLDAGHTENDSSMEGKGIHKQIIHSHNGKTTLLQKAMTTMFLLQTWRH